MGVYVENDKSDLHKIFAINSGLPLILRQTEILSREIQFTFVFLKNQVARDLPGNLKRILANPGGTGGKRLCRWTHPDSLASSDSLTDQYCRRTLQPQN